MTTTDREAILDKLCSRRPFEKNDWVLWMILADACDDEGRYDEAQCYRWMVKNHKRPYRTIITGGMYCHWYDENYAGEIDRESDLPNSLFKLIEVPADKRFREYCSFDSAQDAVAALVMVFPRWIKEHPEEAP